MYYVQLSTNRKDMQWINIASWPTEKGALNCQQYYEYSVGQPARIINTNKKG